MEPTTDTLSRIAGAYLGETVRVSRGTFEGKQRGEAEFVDGVATIRLDGRLWESGELPTVFLHEVAHLVLEHTPRHTATAIDATPAQVASRAATSLQWKRVAQMIARNEREANAWTNGEIKRLATTHGANWWETLCNRHEDIVSKTDRLMDHIRRMYE